MGEGGKKGLGGRGEIRMVTLFTLLIVKGEMGKGEAKKRLFFHPPYPGGGKRERPPRTGLEGLLFPGEKGKWVKDSTYLFTGKEGGEPCTFLGSLKDSV